MPSEPGRAEGAIRVPASCLAECVTYRNRAMHSLLRPYKYKRGEGFARSSYYQHAIAAFREHHRAHEDPKVFQVAILRLRARADESTKRLERVRLEKNIDAIEAYRRIYGLRRFKVLPNHRIGYEIGKITVTVQPDLWVEENGTQVLLKIGMSKKNPLYVDSLLTATRKAAIASGYRVRAKNVVYLDISTGKELICSTTLAWFNRAFKEAAHEIAKVWQNINPPAP
jgi:hypothetical protein